MSQRAYERNDTVAARMAELQPLIDARRKEETHEIAQVIEMKY
jgi:hypothetical protein